jgi:putative hydrolase of the HAD superfamily
MIRAVISDLGQVLLWFDNDIFIRKLAAHGDLSVEEIKEAAHWNMDLITAFDKGGISPREFYERIVKAVGARMSREEFFAIYNDIFWLNARTLEVLKRVKPTCSKLLLLSNTDPERFGFVRKRFSQILIFDDYVLSYELGLVKPEPGIYREALRRAGCAADECVFIDDLPENVEAAVSLGAKGVVYAPTTDLAAELARLGLAFDDRDFKRRA